MSGYVDALIEASIMVGVLAVVITAIVIASRKWGSKETQNVVMGYLIVLMLLAFLFAFASFYGLI